MYTAIASTERLNNLKELVGSRNSVTRIMETCAESDGERSDRIEHHYFKCLVRRKESREKVLETVAFGESEPDLLFVSILAFCLGCAGIVFDRLVTREG